MKNKKRMQKYILPYELTNKIFENSLRMFGKELTRPQFKALKTVVRWLWKNSTTIISHIHSHTIWTKKFIEKISNHLWNMDVIWTVEKKAKLCIKETINERKEKWERNLIAYDESDIFKPNAKCMPWLSMVRDWSTWLTWNWYVFRWVNVNWISLYSNLEELLEWEKWNKGEETIKTIKKVQKDLWKQVWTYLIDRWADDKKVIKFLVEENETFIIRMKKNRNVLNVKNWKMTKITWFKQWIHHIKIWDVELFLCVYKKPTKKDPILLITNDETITEKEAVSLYLKRRKVEEDFKKMKSLWLEDVRLLNFIKIKNLVALIQFVIVLSQDIYQKVKEKEDSFYEHVFLYFKSFTKRKNLTMNPTSFLKFISFSLEHYNWWNIKVRYGNTLFWNIKTLKKMGNS